MTRHTKEEIAVVIGVMFLSACVWLFLINYLWVRT